VKTYSSERASFVKKHCIVNVATGSNNVRGQKRLGQSLRKHGYQGDFLKWTDSYPARSPTHQQVPYAFKFYALMEAIRRGYDTILWLDASFWAVKDPMEVLRVIDARGYALWLCGFSVGQWTKDAALPKLGITREEAFNIPLIMGGAIGISIRDRRALDFTTDMFRYATDGVTFPGAWDNKNQQVSTDPRVRGHRHDQPPISVAAMRRGMEPFGCPYLIAYWTEKIADETVFVCKGM